MHVHTRLLAVGAATAVVALAPATAYAATGSTPTEAGQYAAGQLARTLRATGGHLDYPAAYGGGTDWDGTVSAVLALVGNGVGADATSLASTYLGGHVDSYVKDSKGRDKPGALAGLVLVAHATGTDPHAFGGTDLVARLQATEGAYTEPGASSPTPGLFGAQDPTYDGAYRQSAAMLALVAAGVTPDSAAVGWLAGQQCADGGWTPFRASGSAACAPANEDSNSTAMATMGLNAVHATAAKDPLAKLRAVQEPDGGFGFMAGSGTDANSTALVVEALLARGVDPSSWVKPGGTPWSALTHLQLTCSAPVAARGALDYQAEKTLQPNENATAQAALALAGGFPPVAPRAQSTVEPTMSCPAAAPARPRTVTPAAATAPTAARPTTTVAGNTATLAVTGAPTGTLAAVGGALLVVGAALVRSGRRRRA